MACLGLKELAGVLLSSPMTMFHLLAVPWLLATLPLLVRAQFNFTLSSYPTQCGSLTLSWEGGNAPHTFTFLSLAGIETNYTQWTSGGRWDFTPDQDGQLESEVILPFAEGAPMVVIGSDASGWATGGTSALYTVQASPTEDTSCVVTYDSTEYLTLVPGWSDPPQQCEVMESIFYEVSLPVEIQVVIPGGDSFVIVSPANNTINSTDEFNTVEMYQLYWGMPVTEQTEIAYLVSDADGDLFISGLLTIGSGSEACLQNGTYGYTPAPYAGPVATSAATSSSSSGPNVGAIVGGVVGGVGGLILVAAIGVFLLHRYNRKKRQSKLKMNIHRLSIYQDPASQKPALEGQPDKEGWGKTEDRPANTDWERTAEGLRVLDRVARVDADPFVGA